MKKPADQQRSTGFLINWLSYYAGFASGGFSQVI
jgi:hypothetical protein